MSEMMRLAEEDPKRPPTMIDKRGIGKLIMALGGRSILVVGALS